MLAYSSYKIKTYNNTMFLYEPTNSFHNLQLIYKTCKLILSACNFIYQTHAYKFSIHPDEVENEDLTSEAEMSDQLLESPRKKEGRCCVSINVFYEDVFPHGGIRLGQLHSSFESYAASVYCYC